MNHFIIELANRIIEIKTLHVRPYVMCQDFLSEGKPDLYVECSQEDIDQDMARYESIYGPRTTWDGAVEPITLLRKVADKIIDFNAFFIHGAAIAVNDGAYVFSAPSGTGKTTHIRLWLKNLPNAYIINGDKPIILTENPPLLCSSPWAGKEGYYKNTKIPLKAIIFMERSGENKICQISFIEAFPLLFQQIHRPNNPVQINKVLKLLKSLDSNIAFYRFYFNNYKDDAFKVAYDTLIRNN